MLVASEKDDWLIELSNRSNRTVWQTDLLSNVQDVRQDDFGACFSQHKGESVLIRGTNECLFESFHSVSKILALSEYERLDVDQNWLGVIIALEQLISKRCTEGWTVFWMCVRISEKELSTKRLNRLVTRVCIAPEDEYGKTT